jgi:hypothetical protein
MLARLWNRKEARLGEHERLGVNSPGFASIDSPSRPQYDAGMTASRWVLLLTLLVMLLIPLVAWAMTKAECTRQYNACTAGCRAMADPRLRAACWPACMAAYAGCLAIAK